MTTFAAPPVTELALGVQIEPQPLLGGIRAAPLWDTWRDKYPTLSEMPPLAPHPPLGQQGGPWIQISGNLGVRLWFIDDSQDHIIQLQPDRLIVNWRRQSGLPYPRFPAIMGRFQSAWDTVSSFLHDAGQKLHVQQSEVTYINVIEAPPSDVLKGFDQVLEGSDRYSQANASFVRSIRDPAWEIGSHEIGIASRSARDEQNLTLSLSVKSVPTDRQDPFPSMSRAHDVIVETFSRITTDPMHTRWRRIS